MVNTEAKYFIKEVDVDEISICVGTGSATQENDETAYLLKNKDDVNLSQEQDDIIKELMDIGHMEKDDEDDVVLRLSFQDFLEKFLHLYGDNAQMLCKLMGYSYDDKSYPNTREEAMKMVDTQLSKIHLIKSEDMTQEDIEFLSIVQAKFEKSEGDLPNSAFAYVPDKDKTSTRKLRIDDAKHTELARQALSSKGMMGNRVKIPEKDLPAVKAKVRAAYKKFFPDKEVPEILKSLEKESDVVSGSKNAFEKGNETITSEGNNTPDTISKNKEENMTTEVVTNKLEEMEKSLDETINLLKAAEQRTKEAEERAAKIEKAAEESRIQKAKDDLTQVVKGWESISEDDTAEMVEALYKSESADVIIKHMEAQEERIEKLKSEFGEKEHGEDGEVITKSKTENTQDAVTQILKNRKEANK